MVLGCDLGGGLPVVPCWRSSSVRSAMRASESARAFSIEFRTFCMVGLALSGLGILATLGVLWKAVKNPSRRRDAVAGVNETPSAFERVFMAERFI